MSERHTGVNIAQRLVNVAKEFGITSDNIVGVVRDNVTNSMDVALETLNSDHGWNAHSASCTGHSLQLCVKSALSDSDIEDVVCKCRKIVGHFKHSYVANGAAI